MTITYTPESGPPGTFTQSTDSCVSGDWYFAVVDPNGQPSEIALCPSACEKYAGEGSSLRFAFTCLPD